MDMPGRRELQKTYEDLADEVLIGIAQNRNQEYEDAAAEVAKVVLDSRGVKVAESDVEAPEPLNRSGEQLDGTVIEIPRFSAEESSSIEDIFEKNSIPYERHAVSVSSCSGCGCSEYVFHVPEESFEPAVKLLKEYYMDGMDDASAGYFSGECPACGTELSNVQACTDCGLTLAGDYRESLESHPFIKFLKECDLF
jgi:hypothetical protein